SAATNNPSAGHHTPLGMATMSRRRHHNRMATTNGMMKTCASSPDSKADQRILPASSIIPTPAVHNHHPNSDGVLMYPSVELPRNWNNSTQTPNSDSTTTRNGRLRQSTAHSRRADANPPAGLGFSSGISMHGQ